MLDWRYPIDDLRDQIRKARTERHITTTLDNMEKALDDITSDYTRIEIEESKERDQNESAIYESQMVHWERYLSHYFNKISEYNRLVIAGAFVAYFTVWSHIENYVDPKLHKWSVLFVGVSLVLFVMWEVGSNIYLIRTLRDEAELFNRSGKEYLEQKKKQESKERKAKIGIIPVWYAVLWTTIATGMAGAAILLIGLCFGLIFK